MNNGPIKLNFFNLYDIVIGLDVLCRRNFWNPTTRFATISVRNYIDDTLRKLLAIPKFARYSRYRGMLRSK